MQLDLSLLDVPNDRLRITSKKVLLINLKILGMKVLKTRLSQSNNIVTNRAIISLNYIILQYVTAIKICILTKIKEKKLT